MKKFLLMTAVLFGLSVYGHSYTQTIEQPLKEITEPEEIDFSISNTTWTSITFTSPIKNRDGVVCVNPSTNTGNLRLLFTDDSVVPPVALTIFNTEIRPTDTPQVFDLDETIQIYGNNSSGTETSHCYEFRQR